MYYSYSVFHRSSCSSGPRREGHYCFQYDVITPYVCVRHTPYYGAVSSSIPTHTTYDKSNVLFIIAIVETSGPQASIHPFLPAPILGEIKTNKQTNKPRLLALLSFLSFFSYPALFLFLSSSFSLSPLFPLHRRSILQYVQWPVF
jgi:hypothetical protein